MHSENKKNEGNEFFLKSNLTKPKGTIIFIHGFTSSYIIHNEFTKSKELLNYNYFAMNLKGHTFQDSEELNIENINNYVIQLEKRIQELNLKNLIIIGHSMGGGITALLAEKIERKIKKIILVAPISLSIYWSRVGFKYLFATLKNRSRLIKEIEIGKSRIKNEKVNDYLYYEIARFMNNKKKYLLLGKKLIEPSFLLKVDSAYRKLKIPTLVISGDKDKVVPYKETRRYFLHHVRNRNITFKTLKDVNHVPFVENFDSYQELIWKFIK